MMTWFKMKFISKGGTEKDYKKSYTNVKFKIDEVVYYREFKYKIHSVQCYPGEEQCEYHIIPLHNTNPSPKFVYEDLLVSESEFRNKKLEKLLK